MKDAHIENIMETVEILKQLDKKSLLLIDSGARLLLARQDMEKKLLNKKLIDEVSIM